MASNEGLKYGSDEAKPAINVTWRTIKNKTAGTEGSKETFCNPCGRDKIIENANIYCSDCAELLCNECTKHHKRNKFTATHKLCELKDDIDGMAKLNYLNKISKCEKHVNEEVKYLCRGHNQLCCNECAIVEHRQCRDLVSIATERSTDLTLEEAENNISNINKHASILLEHEHNAVAKVSESEKEVKDMLKCLKGDIDYAFTAVEQALKANLDQQRQSVTISIQSRILRLEYLMNCIKQSELKLNATKEFGKDQQEYLVRRDLTSEIKTTVQILSECHSNSKQEKLALVGSDKIRQGINQYLRQSLAVTVTNIRENLPPLPILSGVKAVETKVSPIKGIQNYKGSAKEFRRSRFSSAVSSAALSSDDD